MLSQLSPQRFARVVLQGIPCDGAERGALRRAEPVTAGTKRAVSELPAIVEAGLERGRSMPEVRAAQGDAPFFNREALEHLNERRAPYLVGGTLACQAHTGTHGIHAGTAHLELFVREADRRRVLDLLRERGWEAIGDVSHWLTKARCGDAVIDVIYGFANGLARVDDLWFRHSVPGHVLDVATRLVPVEEMIWSKAFTMDKCRFEGADVAHLLLTQAGRISWDRLLWRFGRHWRVLLGHLMFFGYVYPERRSLVPQTLVDTLLVLLRHEQDESAAGSANGAADQPTCRGTLLSREEYRVDVDVWGFRDARLEAGGGRMMRDVSRRAAVGEGEAAAGA